MNNLPLVAKIAIAIVACVTIGFFSGFSTAESITSWYVTLNKPFFNPPNWIFAPVWTVLYILMGVAAGLVWDKGTEFPEVRTALILFIVQLALNALWSILFFGMHNPPLALAEIILLWIVLFICIKKFNTINKLAGNLLIPYLAWVSFATILNFSIVLLN